VIMRVQLIADKTSDLADDKLFNVMAVILLMAFVVNLVDDYRQGQLQDMLWICHVSMLLLAAGMYLRRQILIQIAILWIFPGFAFWLVDAFFSGYSVSSALSHIVALSVAYYAWRRMEIKNGLWRHALVFWFTLQILSHWFTPADANVNISHAIRSEASVFFNAYWQYWLFTSIAAAVGLWGLEKLLNKRFTAGN